MNHKHLQAPPLDGPPFAQWVKDKTKEFQDADMTQAMGTQKQQEMIAYWKANRPKMYQRMKALGLLEKLAFVLENLAIQEEDRNLAGGMGWPDSREQAEQAWLLMEPEEDPDAEEREPEPGTWADLQQALDHGRELVAKSQARRAAKAGGGKSPPKNRA